MMIIKHLRAQYLPLRELEDVATALNFDTADCHVIGGCDLYTTKAAGSDKKLYKNIEHSLESQYESLLRFSASLSPPQASNVAASLNLSRSSPFGPLSQVSSRRTFAYFIATLNASHPDYDFSHLLRPTDFRRERSLKNAMNTLDTTLYNLRPKPTSILQDGPPHWSSSITPAAPSALAGNQQWSPKMWRAIDKEMSLKECSIYCYSPEEDPYDAEEGTIWSFNYFFFNKSRKRVCYIYVRGLSIMSDSPIQPSLSSGGGPTSGDWSYESGASKRAKYWLGDRATAHLEGGWDEDDDEEHHMVRWEETDEPRLLPAGHEHSYTITSEEAAASPSSTRSDRSRSKSMVPRAISEEIAESMEV